MAENTHCFFLVSFLFVEEGEVYSFGKNDYGQLGFESNESKSIPTLVKDTLGSSFPQKMNDILKYRWKTLFWR